MSLYRIQGKAERQRGIYYEFDSDEKPLGEGGMGRVFRGRCVDEQRGAVRDVAVKFMYDELRENKSIIERARREASIQIRHDNLVEMLGFIETDERSPLGEVQHHYHIVSELLEGVMLDDVLRGNLTDRNGNVVPLAQKLYSEYLNDKYRFAIRVVRSVLSGLMALHDAGYIHRDIDPTNIMVTTNGHVKLIDFGIAKQMHSLTSHDKSLTSAGVFMGKPEYAAPELVLGDIGNQAQMTDIYAVGVLLFLCITGHVPFEGERHEVLNKQLREKMPLGQIKDKGMRKIVEQATEKSRSKRFQSAAEFRVALDHWSPEPDPFPWWKPIALLVFVLAIALGVMLWPERSVEPGPEPLPVITVCEASRAMRDPKSASDGFTQIKKLSDEGNSHATFLLSRLYFRSNATRDIVADSIQEMQRNVNVDIDNTRAHNLLVKALGQDSTNYQALYELGCDFFGGSMRDDSYGRDIPRARLLFERALRYAREQQDNEYIRIIEQDLLKISSAP